MSQKKSAKDMAFERERAKYRKQIRELQSELRAKEARIADLKEELSEKETEIAEKEDWIRRLLEYTELSPEELKNLLEKEKATADIMDELSKIQDVFRRFGIF